MFHYSAGAPAVREEIKFDAREVIAELKDPWVFRLASDALAEVAATCPDLGQYGWGYQYPLEVTARTVQEFAIARAWLSQLERSRFMETCSYGLKHILERESGYYVPGGTFIAGAIDVGVPQRRGDDGPNSLLGLKLPKAWRRWA
jgi:hypothetical protein